MGDGGIDCSPSVPYLIATHVPFIPEPNLHLDISAIVPYYTNVLVPARASSTRNAFSDVKYSYFIFLPFIHTETGAWCHALLVKELENRCGDISVCCY